MRNIQEVRTTRRVPRLGSAKQQQNEKENIFRKE